MPNLKCGFLSDYIMKQEFITLKEFLSKLKLGIAFQHLKYSSTKTNKKITAKHAALGKRLLSDFSKYHVDVHGVIDADAFEKSKIIYHHPISDMLAKAKAEREQERPYIIISEDEVTNESWVPALSNFHKEIRYLPVKHAVTCKLSKIPLNELFQKNEHFFNKVPLDENEDLFRLLPYTIKFDYYSLLISEHELDLVSNLLWTCTLNVFHEHHQALDFHNWLESMMKSSRAKKDQFLVAYLSWVITNQKFPRSDNLKSVFQDLYLTGTTDDLKIGRGDDIEDLDYSKKYEVYQANERVGKIFMKNLISRCFK